MDLIVRHRQFAVRDADLDELIGRAGAAGLGPHPLRFGSLGRPDHHDRVGGVQLFGDGVGERAMRQQFVVDPDLVACAPQGLGDQSRLVDRRAGI